MWLDKIYAFTFIFTYMTGSGCNCYNFVSLLTLNKWEDIMIRQTFQHCTNNENELKMEKECIELLFDISILVMKAPSVVIIVTETAPGISCMILLKMPHILFTYNAFFINPPPQNATLKNTRYKTMFLRPITNLLYQ